MFIYVGTYDGCVSVFQASATEIENFADFKPSSVTKDFYVELDKRYQSSGRW